ncbi:hypothetical protein ACFX2I_030952 [Malus domestica]
MKAKFVKYSSKCSLALAVAAILDPQFKLKLVEYYYSQIYGSTALDRIKEVSDGLKELFDAQQCDLIAIITYFSFLSDATHCQAILLDQSLQPDQFLLIRVNFSKPAAIGGVSALLLFPRTLDLQVVLLIKLTSQVHEIVGRINGRFGTLTAVPMRHLDRSLHLHALCALYAVTDVALVISLRDGMYLVSYEYVACHARMQGEGSLF